MKKDLGIYILRTGGQCNWFRIIPNVRLNISGGEVSDFDNRVIRGCIQKFPDWPPGARTENIRALCH
jgi:hypothetical protein